VNDLDRDLADRLRGLADDLSGRSAGVRAEEVVLRHRRQRRNLRVLSGVAAVVAVVAVGVPAAVGSLSAAPHPADVAGPGATTSVPGATTAPTPSTTPTPGTARAGEPATSAAPTGFPPVSAAEAGARLAAAQADLARLAGELTEPVVLTSPSAWDEWLPGMKPYPGASTEEDIATCPVLSAGLTAALGHKVSYWTGTLPRGPVGCTWAPVPLQYDTIDYPFTVSVGFLGDGTTAAQEAGSLVTVINGDQPRSCPETELPGGAVLTECWNAGSTSIGLAVPDARGAGVWVLSGDADDDGDVTAEDAFRAVLAGVERVYG
jgi:hypothetical protein